MFLGLNNVFCLQLRAYFSEHGLHGEITFTQNADKSVTINSDLTTTLEYPNQVWTWSVTEFPVDYTNLEGRCNDLGKELTKIDDFLGYLILPENKTIDVTTTELQMTGNNGMYGKALLLKNVETRRRACASLIIVDKTVEKSAVAKFNSPVAGSVHFRWILTKNNQSDMLISTDLYHVRNVENFNKKSEYTEHHWKLFVTDILDSDNDSSDNCNILQLVFDPTSAGNGKGMGDVDSRLGKVKISTDYNRYKFKHLYRDHELILLPSDLTGPQRRLYLVIFERKHSDAFLACAKIRYDHPINAK